MFSCQPYFMEYFCILKLFRKGKDQKAWEEWSGFSEYR